MDSEHQITLCDVFLHFPVGGLIPRSGVIRTTKATGQPCRLPPAWQVPRCMSFIAPSIYGDAGFARPPALRRRTKPYLRSHMALDGNQSVTRKYTTKGPRRVRPLPRVCLMRLVDHDRGDQRSKLGINCNILSFHDVTPVTPILAIHGDPRPHRFPSTLRFF